MGFAHVYLLLCGALVLNSEMSIEDKASGVIREQKMQRRSKMFECLLLPWEILCE